jgi:HK97 family phage prohead protease
MAVWRRIWGALAGTPVAQFSESAPRPIDRVIYEMHALSGRKVSRETALSVPAVKRGRDLICSIATLPLVTRGRDNAVKRSRLLEQIDPDVANVVTLAQTVEDLLFESLAWWEIIDADQDGYPLACTRRDPLTVSTQPPNTTRSPAPLPSGIDPRHAVVWVDGRPVAFNRMIRFDSPNPPILTSGARAIRRAVLLDGAAALYADDPRPLDYFTPAENVDPGTDEEIEAVLAKWRAARKKRSTAFVPAALKYNTVEQPNPRDLQLVELQERAALDVANVLGLDPEDVGLSTTSRTYQNAIDRRRDRINDVLSPYMRAVTDRLSMPDVTRRGTVVDFDLDDYLRADPKTRWEVYEIGQRIGAIVTEEIRVEEKLGPLPPGAKPKPAPAATPPAPSTEDNVDASSDQLWAELTSTGGAQFTDDDGKLQFADVPVTGFTVDRQRRTIEGLALPYGVTASKYGLRFQFLKGALKWGSVNRVKLLRDHRMDSPLGVALNLTDTAAGFRVKFKIARGPAGDDALGLAEDGVLDGLSVGVEFDAGTDAEMNDDGVMLVRRAQLREVSLTAMPAFDDARVTKVAASRSEGEPGMPEQETEATQPQTTPPAPGGLTLNQEQLSALLSRPGALDAIAQAQRPQPAQAASQGGLTLSQDQVDALIKSGRMSALLGLGIPQVTPAPDTDKDDEKRPTVNPVRLNREQHTQVHEALPYRFDRGGNLTRGPQYDFSTDLISGAQGNTEAMARAEKFVRTQFNQVMADFDVDTTDAAALNPNRQRPDMYVDQREYQYPLWNAVNKGTLADSTPFTLPKFSSASGLVAAHTQGVEPTPGAFAATSQTITPSAVSGKVEITREAWDQGGNPQLSGIVWRQMVRAWFEALEASVVTLLDGLTPTGITLTTAAADDALVGELEAALAALHYVRGGFRMRDFAIQIDLYKKLIDAVDGDGRKLLPILGPTNANGTTENFFGSIMVGGLRGVPAWALAASGTAAASSYLFDRESVHGWATAPNRLGFEYRVAYVDLAIWGYKATACTDLTGVREVIYDPAA